MIATSSRKSVSRKHAAGPRVYSRRGPFRGSFGGGLAAGFLAPGAASFVASCARTGTAIAVAIAITAHTWAAKRTKDLPVISIGATRGHVLPPRPHPRQARPRAGARRGTMDAGLTVAGALGYALRMSGSVWRS